MYYIVNDSDQYLNRAYIWGKLPYGFNDIRDACKCASYISRWYKGVVTTRNNERIVVRHLHGKQLK